MNEEQLIRTSQALLNGGNGQDAALLLERFLTDHPNSSNALRALAAIRRHQGRTHEAIILLKSALNVIEQNKKSTTEEAPFNEQDAQYLAEQAEYQALRRQEQAAALGTTTENGALRTVANVMVAELRAERICGRTYEKTSEDQSPTTNPHPADHGTEPSRTDAVAAGTANPWAFLSAPLPEFVIELFSPNNSAQTGYSPSVSKDSSNSELTVCTSGANLVTGQYGYPNTSADAYDSTERFAGEPDDYDIEPDIENDDDQSESWSEPPASADVEDLLDSGARYDLERYEDEDVKEEFWIGSNDDLGTDAQLPPCHEEQDFPDRLSREERARQIAFEVAEDYGWDRQAADLLTTIFEEYYWSAAQVAIRRAIENGLTPKELALGEEVRQMWYQRCEFWACSIPGGGVAQKYALVSWPTVLGLLRSFEGYPQVEEIEAMLDDCLEQWSGSQDLQRRFPAFFSFALYRSGAHGDLSGIDGWYSFQDTAGDEDPADDTHLQAELARRGIQIQARWSYRSHHSRHAQNTGHGRSAPAEATTPETEDSAHEGEAC